MVNWSIVEYCGLSEKSRCGYCKNTRQRASLGEEDGNNADEGCFGHVIDGENFMRLLEYGWSGSGKYMYKPTMERTCCPQYTIRLDSSKFILSRSQRRVLREMNLFLKNDTKPRNAVREEAPVETKNAPSSVRNEMKDAREMSDRKNAENPRSMSKKKEIRRQRCFERWRAKGLDVEEMKRARALKEEARRRTVESYIMEPDSTWKHKLEVKLVSTSSELFRERYDESYLLYEKYQKIIHKDDDPSKAGFKRFLVDSPLFDDEPSTGSYHQWYLLDGKLIAVGVVDILPRCVSSKYLYYDPDYAFLSLGTYTALREIAFTRYVMKQRPEAKYYYMGYYISTCPKMRYKGKFRPSELLCDRTFQWVPLDVCDRMLQNNCNNFTVFLPDSPPAEMQTRDQLLLLIDGKLDKLFAQLTVCCESSISILRVIPSGRYRTPLMK
ncbi:unnamed protein product [Nippostrongylus brasiliensis]|uniref:Arginyl-tRNA--protein transferase 1 n=1 Tax=Nippostrongylus brasiliensis TaxID=27835 RepID=A0A0N4XC50_NIPBR|nr:unnamed protein product [Nippostrongylus brasiliensis]